MGRVVPFYIPDSFKPRVRTKSETQREPARVIEFRPAKAVYYLRSNASSTPKQPA
jgi:hypothetical protein